MIVQKRIRHKIKKNTENPEHPLQETAIQQSSVGGLKGFAAAQTARGNSSCPQPSASTTLLVTTN